MKAKLNVKLFGGLVAGTALFLTGWFFLHRYQTRRLIADFVQQADRAEAEGRLDRAARLLRHYVVLVPADLDARTRYGTLLEKSATTGRARQDALAVFEQVLQQDPARHDVRNRAGLLAARLGRHQVALAHLTNLRDAGAGDAESELVRAGCLAATGDHTAAKKAYQECVKNSPAQVAAYVGLANLLRKELKDPEEADRVVDKLVLRNPQSAAAYLARALYRQEFAAANARERAEQDLAGALRLAPDGAEVLLAAAQFHADRAASNPAAAEGALAAARDHLEHGLAKHPADARFYELLADVEVRAGRNDKAIARLREGRQRVPRKFQRGLLWKLADLLIRGDRLADAQEVIAHLTKNKLAPEPRLTFLLGRVRAREGKWYEASGLLENVRPLLADAPELVVQTDLQLGYCYERLGDIDRQLAVFRRAARLDPLGPLPRIGTAAALVRLGRLDEAVEEYRRVVSLPRAPADAWAHLARLLILRNLGRDPAARRWDAVDEALKVAAKAQPDSVTVPILRAEALVAQEKFAEARQQLVELRERRPADVEPWVVLAGLAERQGKFDEALTTLDEAEKKLGDGAALRLARVRFVPARKEAGVRALARLARGLGRFTAPEQAQLLRGLAAAYAQLGEWGEARSCWLKLAALEPGDLGVRLVLFDVALRGDDEEAMRRRLGEIRELEGAGGPLGRYGDAAHLTWRARQGERHLLAEARTALAAVAARRPGWSRVPLALAGIDELDGNPDRAVENYQKALELGDRQFAVVRRLVELLYERHRYAEADEAIRKLQEQAPISNDLCRLAAEVSLRNLNADRALRLAHQAVPGESADYRDRLWLGQILWAAGKRDEGEKEMRRAAELGRGVAHPWVVLVRHQARAGEIRKAEATIEEARKAIRPAEAPLALAQCCEAVARTERAAEEYRKALEAAPTDLRVLQSTANFHQRAGRPRDAEPLLRRMLDPRLRAPEETAAWARRNLAVGLGVGGDSRQVREALALLEENMRGGGGRVEDQRARAVVLAARPESRAEAIALLEKSFKTQPPTPDQEFLLARLYEGQGEWSKARARMLRLLGTGGGDPRHASYVSAFVAGLLRHGEVAEAKPWADQLERLRPHAFTTASHQARIAAELGKGEDVVRLSRRYVDDKKADTTDPAVRLQRAAGLLEGLAQDFPAVAASARPAADELYRRYAEESRRPEALLVLAGYRGRQGRVNDALDLCERAAASCPAEEVAAAAVTVVTGAAATPEQLRRAERWALAAAEKGPRSAQLPVYLAALRERQGKYAEAEALLRTVLAQDGGNVAALNNLAALLALRGRGAEAGKLVGRAVERAGPQGELLDTRALVHLAGGAAGPAVKDLRRALAEKRTPARLFHLAQAHRLADNRTEAAKALRDARALGLSEEGLHPLEREAYRRLLGELGPK